MDFKGRAAVLSAILILVGIIFLAPAITEKALAFVVAQVKGVCGVPFGESGNKINPLILLSHEFQMLFQTHPCQFT